MAFIRTVVVLGKTLAVKLDRATANIEIIYANSSSGQGSREACQLYVVEPLSEKLHKKESPPEGGDSQRFTSLQLLVPRRPKEFYLEWTRSHLLQLV